MDRAEVERLDEWPLVKGILGRRRVGGRSTPKDELRLELPSKWPDLFSLSVAVRANPESFREGGVVGSGGKLPETGDIEDGGLALFDLLVEGLGLSIRVWSFFDCRNALKTRGLFAVFVSGSPNVVEFSLTYFASELGGAFCVKIAAFSEENASYGKVSIA
jgi:hypothetical protein